MKILRKACRGTSALVIVAICAMIAIVIMVALHWGFIKL